MIQKRGDMIRLDLSSEMVMAMAQVLRAGPYNIVAPILVEIQKQVNEQQPAPAPISNGKSDHDPLFHDR